MGNFRMPRSSTIRSGTENEQFHAFFAGSVDRGFGQVIEQFMGFAIEHAIALLDSGLSDGLSEMAFAGAGRP
ncbi:MAG: hypothetical protein ABR881_10895 [Candidatus Sulfotelmatobacter sp.]|jgi:hypothetical protein